MKKTTNHSIEIHKIAKIMIGNNSWIVSTKKSAAESFKNDQNLLCKQIKSFQISSLETLNTEIAKKTLFVFINSSSH